MRASEKRCASGPTVDPRPSPPCREGAERRRAATYVKTVALATAVPVLPGRQTASRPARPRLARTTKEGVGTLPVEFRPACPLS